VKVETYACILFCYAQRQRQSAQPIANSDRQPICVKPCPDYRPSEFAKRRSITTVNYRYIALPTGLNQYVRTMWQVLSAAHRNLDEVLISYAYRQRRLSRKQLMEKVRLLSFLTPKLRTETTAERVTSL
jgi:hypothetical protein